MDKDLMSDKTICTKVSHVSMDNFFSDIQCHKNDEYSIGQNSQSYISFLQYYEYIQGKHTNN